MSRSVRVRPASSLYTFALTALTALTAGVAALAVGCAADSGGDGGDATVASTEHGVTSAKEPALDVKATWRRYVTGTPTYGYDATEPFLTVELLVDDAALRTRTPGFDGLERPFALLPRKGDDGAVRWERIALGYRGETRRGYYAERRIDVYEAKDLRLGDKDLEAVLALGVAVGLDTNRGTIWAQDSGANFRVERVGP